MLEGGLCDLGSEEESVPLSPLSQIPIKKKTKTKTSLHNNQVSDFWA